jgi:methionyl aminopeptidase
MYKNAIPAPLNYAPDGHTPYPKSICTSVNHQICHGVPGDKVLKNGDTVNIDITVIKDGYHGDTSRMFPCWRSVYTSKNVCQKSLIKPCGLVSAKVKPDATLGDIGPCHSNLCRKKWLQRSQRVFVVTA